MAEYVDEDAFDLEEAMDSLYGNVLKTKEPGSWEHRAAERYFANKEGLKNPLGQLEGQSTYIRDGVECWDPGDYPEQMRLAGIKLREGMGALGVTMNPPPINLNPTWLPIVEIHREDKFPFHAYLYYNGTEQIPKKDQKDYYGKSASLTSAYSLVSDASRMKH